MSGSWALLLLIFISAIPAIGVYIWFRVIRYPFSPACFLLSLLAGAAAFFPALLLQNFFAFPGMAWASGKGRLLFHAFVRIALTEELSRFIVLAIFWRISVRPASVSYSHVVRGSAVGLAAGLGFALLESAAYGASDAGVTLLRTFTAAPLHGACGSRAGAAAALFREHPLQAVFRLLSATAIHGIYNCMIVMPGFPAIAAVLIALSALVSSLVMFQTGTAA